MTAALGITLCKNPFYRVSVSLFARVTSVKSAVCRSQYSTAAAPELVRDSKGRQVLTSKENAKFEAYYKAQVGGGAAGRFPLTLSTLGGLQRAAVARHDGGHEEGAAFRIQVGQENLFHPRREGLDFLLKPF